MAIQKKIQLYVSDVTGATKSSKYYRIPLPADTKPANRRDNILKDMVRYYAKVSGDKFYMGLVVKPSVDSAMIYEESKDALAANLTPSIPDKLMNDGEGLIRFDTIYEYGIGYDKNKLSYGINPSNFTEDRTDDISPYGYMKKKKNNIFSAAVISDTETDLSSFVPSNWQEFDSIDEVLADIQTWGAAKLESRGPVFSEHTVDEFYTYASNYMASNSPQIDIENGTVTDEYQVHPDVYEVAPYNGQATITFTSDVATTDSKLYVVAYKYDSGNYSAQEVREVPFTGNTAIVNFDGTTTTGYNRACIQLSHDVMGHVTVVVTKN